MNEQHRVPEPQSVRYVGLEKTRQYPAGHWLEPGEIISGPPGLVMSLSVLPDFEIVDTTLALPVDESPDEAEDEEV